MTENPDTSVTRSSQELDHLTSQENTHARAGAREGDDPADSVGFDLTNALLSVVNDGSDEERAVFDHCLDCGETTIWRVTGDSMRCEGCGEAIEA